MKRTGPIWIAIVAAAMAVGAAELDDEARQMETMTALCTIGAAIEEYSIDHDRYPQASGLAALEALVVPRYTEKLPQHDGWGNAFFIDSNPTVYTLGSCGKGVRSGCNPALVHGHVELTDPSEDIIFANGRFVTWPKGSPGPTACRVFGASS